MTFWSKFTAWLKKLKNYTFGKQPNKEPTIITPIPEIILPEEKLWRPTKARKKYLLNLIERYTNDLILPNQILVVKQDAPNWLLIFTYSPNFYHKLRELGIVTSMVGTPKSGRCLRIKKTQSIKNSEPIIAKASEGIFSKVFFTNGKLLCLHNPPTAEPDPLDEGKEISLWEIGEFLIELTQKEYHGEMKNIVVSIYCYRPKEKDAIATPITKLPERIKTRQPFLLFLVSHNHGCYLFELEVLTDMVEAFGAVQSIDARTVVANRVHNMVSSGLKGVGLIS
jgi:hypothetical protein